MEAALSTIAHPQVGDILITFNGQGGLFIHRAMPAKPGERCLHHDWLASSTSMLRQRGVCRYGRHARPSGENYQDAPDFTVGRVRDKGQCRHLLRKYLPEIAAGDPRILIHRDPFYYLDEEKPLLAARKPSRK